MSGLVITEAAVYAGLRLSKLEPHRRFLGGANELRPWMS